jgi:hypothetical protein
VGDAVAHDTVAIVRIGKVDVRNYRCFEQLSLDVNSESLTLVAANAGGKTSLLTAIHLGLQNYPRVDREDVRDLDQPVEIVVTLADLSQQQQGDFVEALRFEGDGPVVRLGVQAAWNMDELEMEQIHGYPDLGWQHVGRSARECVQVIWLRAQRDPTRLLPFVGSGSVMARVVENLPLDAPLDQALSEVRAAGDQLAQAPVFAQLMQDLTAQLTSLIPSVNPVAYSLGYAAAEARDLLRHFELMLAHQGPAAVASKQSTGLSQLAIFALALLTTHAAPETVLLVDEPEVGLHPHAQRALVVALRGAGQVLMATHSSSVLDRADPRTIVRLQRELAGGVTPVRAAGLSRTDARRLARYATPQTTEAFFAETVILVEGISDLLAIRMLARRSGRDLDGAGATLLSLDGGGGFVHYLALFGPNGLDLRLLGLVDADHEQTWSQALTKAGVPVAARGALNAAGVQVCDPDLEGELVVAIGTHRIAELLADEAQTVRYQTWVAQKGLLQDPLERQQAAWIGRSSASKVFWAPVLAENTPLDNIPAPLCALLTDV